MPFRIKARERRNKPLTIGLAGGPGSGKTWSAFLIAQGLSNGERFACIDTEGGRAMLYEEQFDFDHSEITSPFDAETYMEAIAHYNSQGRRVIVIDNASHEWSGVGGLLDQQEDELTRLAGNDFKKRDRCGPLSWKGPKKKHDRFISFLETTESALILCFRAKSKIEMVRNEKGKMEIQEKRGLIGYRGWFPLVEKNMPFELTAYFMLNAENPGPGIPHPIKLIDQHKPIFPPGKPITVSTGEQLAEWAKRKKNRKAMAPASTNSAVDPPAYLGDMIASIRDADTIEELQLLADDIQTLPETQRVELRPVYGSKLTELKEEIT